MFKQGNGARRMIVFEDPNCHYCKDAEHNFAALKNVTIYTFLIPILGDDSVAKARTIWCSRNNAQVWRTWMLQGVMPPRPMGACDVKALDRNLDLAERYHLNYTPAIIFDDGSKFAGNADLEHLTKRLDEVAARRRRAEPALAAAVTIGHASVPAARRARPPRPNDSLPNRGRRRGGPPVQGHADHRRPGARTAVEPARVDPGQLHGARVLAPPEPARGAPGHAAAAAGAARQGSLERRHRGPRRAGRHLLRLRVRPSVRTAWLSDDRGFFNTTSLCLAVEGRTAEAHRVELYRLPAGWDVATAMTRVDAPARRGQGRARPRRRARRSSSRPTTTSWPTTRSSWARSGAARSRRAASCTSSSSAGAWPQFDGARLLADTKRICDEEIRFWHGSDKPPFSRYVFMLYATEDGYGGLEHRASTALIAARKDLPRLGVAGTSDGYVTLLGLISHEYFHTWNVKRLKPAEFLPYDYTQENYTELLWFFEGFTSYYDDLFLLRARPDRRGALRQAGGPRDERRAPVAGPARAERGRGELRRLDQVLPQPTRTRPIRRSATTPRARWWRCAWTSRCAPAARPRWTT